MKNTTIIIATISILALSIFTTTNAAETYRSKEIVFVDYKKDKFYSNDYGRTWSQIQKATENYRSKEILFTDYKKDTYYSNDYGRTWTQVNISDIIEGNSFEIKLYPNPVIQYLTIDLNETVGNAKLEIFDILANKILQINTETKNSIKIDLSNLNAGIYSLAVTIDGKTSISKFTLTK